MKPSRFDLAFAQLSPEQRGEVLRALARYIEAARPVRPPAAVETARRLGLKVLAFEDN